MQELTLINTDIPLVSAFPVNHSIMGKCVVALLGCLAEDTTFVVHVTLKQSGWTLEGEISFTDNLEKGTVSLIRKGNFQTQRFCSTNPTWKC